jgi:hypothetical protein
VSATIYGASDDLIEVEGDIREEFYAVDGPNYLAFSNGTLLSVVYDDDGMWRIRCLSGAASVTLADDPDTNYSDRADVPGDLLWVAQATGYAKKVQPSND